VRSAGSNASSVNGASGVRQKLTWLSASVVWAAMKPASRPISLTSPMPLRAPIASRARPRWPRSRLSRGRLEAEGALVDEVDVVVDRFGHAHHGDGQPAPGDLGGDGLGAAQRAVAPDREEDADAALDQRIDHAAEVLIAARRAQQLCRRAVLMCSTRSGVSAAARWP
jgi:hypothetical protein